MGSFLFIVAALTMGGMIAGPVGVIIAVLLLILLAVSN